MTCQLMCATKGRGTGPPGVHVRGPQHDARLQLLHSMMLDVYYEAYLQTEHDVIARGFCLARSSSAEDGLA